MKTPFDHHRDLPCICFGIQEECVCPDGEVAVRHYASPRPADQSRMPPMTEEQRLFCLREIGRVEGFRQSMYANASDCDLAQTLLEAWLEFARDKGLTR